MEPTQRRNTYTPVMEKTQKHTIQESEEKKKLTFATAEQLETNDEKKKGTPEGIKLSKDSKKFKLRTAELPTSKETKEPMRTAEAKKDSKVRISCHYTVQTVCAKLCKNYDNIIRNQVS
ncbi:hypothetical protein ANCCAN_06022 [Ancylostoma caninum]|uniref:Uncharacterized protein n=1 Tax=Ancylostoma caninum TaxID=29170 RepID=A0A368GYA2_ANCCA|nr:hypothetical protein ANCCAN_06022 [Ancylostoma caninum]